MGRSRGGLTTKIHALVDAEGRPIHLKLTEGQAHDGRSAADMFETLEAGNILVADRAYDSDALRPKMAERGAWANIRAMPNRVKTFPFSSGSIDSATPSSASSANSNTSEPWRPDTTSATTTSSHRSNSPQSASGCVLMSRSPRVANGPGRTCGPRYEPQGSACRLPRQDSLCPPA